MYADLDRKVCTKCKLSKSCSEFTKDRTRKDGLFPWCKVCKKDLDAENYKKNPAKVKAASKLWKKANPTKVSLSNAGYKKRNPDKVNADTRGYKRKNKGVTNANTAKRRAALLQRTPKWLTEDELRQIRALYEKAAELTKETGIPYEVDHIIPLQGDDISGLHVLSNLQILTEKENESKKNKFKF